MEERRMSERASARFSTRNMMAKDQEGNIWYDIRRAILEKAPTRTWKKEWTKVGHMSIFKWVQTGEEAKVRVVPKPKAPDNMAEENRAKGGTETGDDKKDLETPHKPGWRPSMTPMDTPVATPAASRSPSPESPEDKEKGGRKRGRSEGVEETDELETKRTKREDDVDDDVSKDNEDDQDDGDDNSADDSDENDSGEDSGDEGGLDQGEGVDDEEDDAYGVDQDAAADLEAMEEGAQQS